MMTDAELIKEIRKYRCADLSDGMDAIGLVDKGTMNETMRPIRPTASRLMPVLVEPILTDAQT